MQSSTSLTIRARRPLAGRAGLLALAGVLTLAAVCGPARADDFVTRVNQRTTEIAPSKRSDLVILPLLAKLEPPPKEVATVEQAALLPAGKQGWNEAASWAQSASQKAALEGLTKVTRDIKDWRTAWAFGQPYGIDGVSPDLIRAKMYTELGDPPMLAAAQHLYLPAFDRLGCLVNVEATRLAADGKPSDAIDLLIDWVYFARQICDRAFYAEAAWGLKAIDQGEERIRDIAYTDFRASTHAMDREHIHEQLERLSENTDKYLDLSRMDFPQGNRIAAEQVVARVYNERGGVNDQTFATTMSRLGSTEHPLRLFSEAARWRTIAGDQANWFDARDKAKGIQDDWAMRWRIDWYDNRMRLLSVYSKLDRQKFAAVDAATPDEGDLIQFRQVDEVEGVGTRLSLALVGYTLAAKMLPPVATAVRPLWMTALEADPYNPERAAGAKPPLEFFVPIRDQQRTERQEREPHTMLVFTPNGEDNFKKDLFDDTFVLYSRGSDNHKDYAKRVQNTWKTVQGADYLIWPPYLSLYREHLIDRGDIK